MDSRRTEEGVEGERKRSLTLSHQQSVGRQHNSKRIGPWRDLRFLSGGRVRGVGGRDESQVTRKRARCRSPCTHSFDRRNSVSAALLMTIINYALQFLSAIKTISLSYRRRR